MPHVPDQLWRATMRRPGLELYGFALAGLRGGGATDFYLRLQDVLRVLRRGRSSLILAQLKGMVAVSFRTRLKLHSVVLVELRRVDI
jgi:hypothetical protein